MKTGLFCVRLFTVLVFAISVFSQSKESTVRVSVNDNKSRSVKDLKKEDFILKENGVPQEIIQLKSGEDEPLSVLILMDVSGSISENIKQLNAKAALEFIQKSNIKNDYAISEFSDTLKESADWGSTDEQIVSSLKAIAKEKISIGNTSLYSAIFSSLQKFESAKYRQKVLLLFSDGRDNDTKKQIINNTKDILRKSDIVFYGITVMDFDLTYPIISGQSTISELSGITGGESYFT
jgi:Ca-activated chloride channel homolog